MILFPFNIACALSLPVPDTLTVFASYPVPDAFSPFVTLNIKFPMNMLYPVGASTSLTVIVSAVFMSFIFIVP